MGLLRPQLAVRDAATADPEAALLPFCQQSAPICIVVDGIAASERRVTLRRTHLWEGGGDWGSPRILQEPNHANSDSGDRDQLRWIVLLCERKGKRDPARFRSRARRALRQLVAVVRARTLESAMLQLCSARGARRSPGFLREMERGQGKGVIGKQTVTCLARNAF